MWIAKSDIKTTTYNYLTDKPSKQDFITDSKNFTILNSSSVSFLGSYQLIKLDFLPFFAISDFRSNTSYNIRDFVISNETVYIDDTDIYFKLASVFDLPIVKSYYQHSNVFKTPEVYPIYLLRSSSLNTNVYGTFRYTIENIGNISDLNIFFTDSTTIRNIFITKTPGEPIQLINKSFLDTYPFLPETQVSIDYRVKIYDPSSSTLLSLFNNKISKQIKPVAVFSHSLVDPFSYNLFTDGLNNYKRITDYNDLNKKGFIITDSYVFIING